MTVIFIFWDKTTCIHTSSVSWWPTWGQQVHLSWVLLITQVTLSVNNSASIYYLERQHLLSLAVCHSARLIAENPIFLPFPY